MESIQHQALPNGSRIGVYEIQGVQVISHFSIVYRGWNHHLNIMMAVEEYLPLSFAVRAADGQTVEPASENKRESYLYGLSEFIGQAENLMEIEHPNIVTVNNVLQHNGTAYLAMDYEDGLPLSRLCDSHQHQFDEDELKVIIVPILGALQKVHEQGFFHGAVIPANILMRKDGEPILINFAAARLALATQSGTLPMILNKGYAPLEQHKVDGHYGPWTDLYTLGATMYHCVSGTMPVAAIDRESALEKNDPDPLPLLQGQDMPKYSKALLTAIDSMLALQFDERPVSAAAVIEALDLELEGAKAKELQDRGLQAEEFKLPEEETAIIETASRDPMSTSESVTQSQPLFRPSILIGLGLAVAALLGGGVWFLDHNRYAYEVPIDTNVEQPSTERTQQGEVLPQVSEEHTSSVGELKGGGGRPPVDSVLSTTPSGIAVQESPKEKPVLTQSNSNKAEEAGESGMAPADAAKPELRAKPPSDTEVSSGGAPEFDGETDARQTAQQSGQDKGEELPDAHRPEASGAVAGIEEEMSAVPKHAVVNGSNVAEQPPVPNAVNPDHENATDSQPLLGAKDNSQTQQETIHNLMVSAQQHLAEWDLTTPPGENALQDYQTILAMAPENSGAREGLDQIVIRYEWLIDKALKDKEYRRARVYLNRVSDVLPSTPRLQELRAQLEAAEAAAQPTE